VEEARERVVAPSDGLFEEVAGSSCWGCSSIATEMDFPELGACEEAGGVALAAAASGVAVCSGPEVVLLLHHAASKLKQKV